MKMVLSNSQKLRKHKLHVHHVHHVHHSSRARETGIFLQTSMLLAGEINAKVTVELYHDFPKYRNFDKFYKFKCLSSRFLLKDIYFIYFFRNFVLDMI